MKRILFVFHNSDLLSGATRSLMNIVDDLLDTEKYEICAVFPYQEGTASEHLKSKGVKVFTFRYGKLMKDLTFPLWKKILKFPLFVIRHLEVCLQASKAAKTFADYDFDMVYSNTSSIIFGGLLGKKLGCRQIWHIREFRTLDHKITFYLGEKWIKNFIQKNSNAVLCVGQAVKNYQSDIIDPKKMFVTYNSYSPDFICPRDRFNTSKPLRLLLAGDIKPGKGQFEAVKAIASVNKKYPGQVVLNLAGRESDSKYAAEIKDFIARNNLENCVNFLGFCSDMKSVRKKADAGLVTSENEAFGRTAIEGMLSMMAMIGRNSGGTSEQIKNDETGLLYDGSVSDLARCICTLAEDRGLLQKFAKAGFEDAKKYASGYAAKVTEQTIDLVFEDKL